MQPASGAGVRDDHALTEHIRAERVRFVFVQSAVPIFFSPLAAAILSLALWKVVDHGLLVGWTIGLLVIAVIRVVLIRSFPQSAADESQVKRWERIFVSSIVAVDLWWGFGALFLLVPDAHAERGLVFCFVMLMAGGHSASYAAHPGTVTLGVLSLTVPITFHFALQPDTFHRALAFAAVMYLLALFRSVKTLGYFFGRTHRLAHELEKLARIDFLTALNNRRAFYELGTAALHRAAVLMIDIDHFKAINDREGHAAGDAVLKALADVIRENVRKTDIAGRVGGEEFAILLPETTIEEAAGIAERLRSGAEERGFTLSAGVAAVEPDEKLEHLVARADAALYAAKRGGRNRVVTTTPARALSAAM